MHFKRQSRRSVRITWNDYFRADFPLKKIIVLHARSLIFTQKIYIRTHFSLSVPKKSMLAGFREVCGLKDRSRQKGVFLLRTSAQLELWQRCGLKA